jgi:hypothetical protein
VAGAVAVTTLPPGVEEQSFDATGTIHAGRALPLSSRHQRKESPMAIQTVLIPASVQLDLREALLTSVEYANQEMDGYLVRPEREHRPEWFSGPRRQLSYIWPIIDRLGWGKAEDAQDIEIALAGPSIVLLCAAIEGHLTFYEEWIREADANDASRAQRGLPPRKEEHIRRAHDLEAFLKELEAYS